MGAHSTVYRIGDTSGNDTLLSVVKTCCLSRPTLDGYNSTNGCHYSYCNIYDDSQKSDWSQCASSNLIAKGINSLNAINYGCDNATDPTNATLVITAVQSATTTTKPTNLSSTPNTTSTATSSSSSKHHSKASFTLPIPVGSNE
jgi:hypothetical protein